MAMLESQSRCATIDEDVVILEVYSLNRPPQSRPLGVVTFGSTWRRTRGCLCCSSGPDPPAPAYNGRTRSRGPCRRRQEERRRGRSRTYLPVPLYTFKPGSKVDNMVRQLETIRVDHHLHYHCQLRCNGARQQTARRRQNRIVARNGKSKPEAPEAAEAIILTTYSD